MASPDTNLRYSQYDFAFTPASRRSSSNDVPSLHRVSSFDSRQVRREPNSGSSEWKHTLTTRRSLESLGNSSSTADRHPSPSLESHYDLSMPSTGSSVASDAGFWADVNPLSWSLPHTRDGDQGTRSGTGKTYSFVALPGSAIKKRPRRRYDEIERLYQCSWPTCTKAYATLNHLNAHITMQKHGSQRSPNEFKELRKQWREARNDAEAPHRAGGSTRRGGTPDHHDDPTAYDSARYDHNVHDLHRHPHMGTSMSLSHIPHPAPTLSDTHYPYVSPVPSQRHGRPTQINVHHDPSPSPPPPTSALPRVAPRHLPPDSTLLTPLSDYQPHLTLPPLRTLDMYGSDGTGRLGTGHASIGLGSDDEFERRI